MRIYILYEDGFALEVFNKYDVALNELRAYKKYGKPSNYELWCYNSGDGEKLR